MLPLHVEVSLNPEDLRISEIMKSIAAELIKNALNENKDKVSSQG